MKNLIQIIKKIPKKSQKALISDPSKLLADFLNGIIIELEEEYSYE